MQIRARYFDGKTAKSLEVIADIRDAHLYFTDEAGQEIDRWPLGSIRDENVPPSADRLSLSKDVDKPARLVIEDREFVEALVHRCPELRKRRKLATGWWRPYAYATTAAVASVVLFFMVGLPLLASTVASTIPVETRVKIGRTIEDHMIHKFAAGKEEDAICVSDAGQAALETLVRQFAQASGQDMPPISVTVVNSKVANAFALPGGRMIILSALIEKADNPNALAGILAHEFGHIEGKHPTSLFVTNIGIATVLSLALGDVTGGTVIAGIGQMALGAAYSRDFERYADKRSFELMSYWKYDISPALVLLAQLQKGQQASPGIFSLFSSHPDTAERLDLLLAEGSTGAGKALSDEDWQAVKIMCENSI